MNHKMKTKTIPTLLATAILTACGGGGGTSTGSASPTATSYFGTCGASSTVSQAAAQALCVPVSVPIVTSIPATTYAAGSQEKLAFDYLNNARSTCGFGLLAQDTKLDAAAANHAAYITGNNDYSHYETQGNPGFTGYSSVERAAYMGYVGTLSEVLAGDISKGTTANSFSVDSVRSLLAAPYHFRSMMEGWRDIGVGIRYASATSGSYIVSDPGYKSTAAKQQPAAGTVLTYPCQGTTDVETAMAGEQPWPIPGRTNAIGQPVLVQVAEGSTLVLNTYTMTRVGGAGIDAGTVANGSVAGNASPLLKLDWSNDTNSRFTNRYNVAMLMPDKVMYAGGVYRVQVMGTVDGALFNKDFTFTTGKVDAYNSCLSSTNTNINNNYVYGGGSMTLTERDRQLGLVPFYCSGASGGNLVAPTANTLAKVF